MRIRSDWQLTPERAAIHLPSATAVIADLHLGYALARRRRGEAIPEAGIEEARAGLQALTSRSDVRRLVIAGDLVEDASGGPLALSLLIWLRDRVELLGIVPGNHDRGLSLPADLPLYPDGLLLDNWRVVHGDGPLPGGCIVQGHYHPCVRADGGVSAPCYLVAENHLVLPAWSADAAGVNVLGNPHWRRYRCCVPAGDRVLDFGVLGQLRRGHGQPRGQPAIWNGGAGLTPRLDRGRRQAGRSPRPR